MLRLVVSFLAGGLFAVGLAIGGMTQPGKVLAFLDVAGDWDVSLAFVMAGAIAVYAPIYALVSKQRLPTLAKLAIPSRRDINFRLVGGAGLFGLGWGLGGFCPGPGLVSATSGAAEALAFTAAMLLGMGLFRVFQSTRAA